MRHADGPLRQMLTQAPAHARVPEAMLAVSNVQVELKDTKAARKTLEELVKQYPSTEAAQAARDRLLTMPAPRGAAAPKKARG